MQSAGCTAREAWASGRGGPEVIVEKRVDVVGDVLVVEWHGVGLVAQCGGGVAMAEARLRLEELAVGDELGADAVT